MEARNEIGTKGNLRFIRIADRLGRMKAHIATMPENAQPSNSIIPRRKPRKANKSWLSQNNYDKSASSDEDREHSGIKYQSASLSSKGENTFWRCKKNEEKKVEKTSRKLLAGSWGSVAWSTLV